MSAAMVALTGTCNIGLMVMIMMKMTSIKAPDAVLAIMMKIH